jgi:hypothetical protein
MGFGIRLEIKKRIDKHDYRGSYSITVMYCKVSQRYLIKSLRKKKNSDWDIKKILIFPIENKELSAHLNLLPSTLDLVTAPL